jgi:chromosome segregation ATPase
MSARNFVITLLGVALSAGVAGCATEEEQAVKRAEQTAASLSDVLIEVTAGKKQLDATTQALGKLTSQTGGHLRPGFETYMKELARLQVQADRAKARADDLYARADAYIDKWQQDATKLQNPDLKKEAEVRRTKIKSSIAAIQTAARAAGDAYRPLLQDLTDIQTALSNDLTEAGIAAVKPTAATAIDDAGKLQSRIDALIAELNRVRDELSPKG